MSHREPAREEVVICSNENDFRKFWRDLKATNVGFAYTKIGFPKKLHVIYNGDKATIREME